jgi:hypothetical protein
MGQMRMFGLSLICAVALAGVLAGDVSATEYGIKGLPEFGRCVRVRHGTGQFHGPHCLSRGGGSFDWLPGPQPGKAKVKYKFGLPTDFQSLGKSKIMIKCAGGVGEGEYISEKILRLTTVALQACENPAVAGFAGFCQTAEAPVGEF